MDNSYIVSDHIMVRWKTYISSLQWRDSSLISVILDIKSRQDFLHIIWQYGFTSSSMALILVSFLRSSTIFL